MKRVFKIGLLELIIVTALLAIIGLVIWAEKRSIEKTNSDNDRKTAINAMHYALEEVYFKANASYPVVLTANNLPAIDPLLLTDPNGRTIGDRKSDYRYISSGCEVNKCRSYTLRANLEKEVDFIKTSRN